MLCGGHEPGAGIVWNAGLGPAFECGDKSILREFFGETNVANDARESGNNFGGLDSPDGVDDAMSGGGFDLRGHGDPFQLVKESAYEKDFTSERGAASSIKPRSERPVGTPAQRLRIRMPQLCRRRFGGAGIPGCLDRP